MKNVRNSRRRAGMVAWVMLIGGLWSGPARAGADCLEGPWAEVGRFFGSGGVVSVAWSPDGTQLAGGSGYEVRVWAADDGRLLRTLTGHMFAVSSVAWSPDGMQLASGSYDTKVRVWAADDGRLLRTLTEHTSWVRSVAWSPDGTQLASAGGYYDDDFPRCIDCGVRVWAADDGHLLRPLSGYTGPVLSVAWSPDSTQLAW